MDWSWTIADFLYFMAWVFWILAPLAVICGFIRLYRYRPDTKVFNRYQIEQMAEWDRDNGMPRFEHWLRYGKGFFGIATVIMIIVGIVLWGTSCFAWEHQNQNRWKDTNLVGYATSQEIEAQEWQNTCRLANMATASEACSAKWQTTQQDSTLQAASVDRADLRKNLQRTQDFSATQRQLVDTTYLLVFQRPSGELYQVGVDEDTWTTAELGQPVFDFVNPNFGEVILTRYTDTGDNSPVYLYSIHNITKIQR